MNLSDWLFVMSYLVAPRQQLRGCCSEMLVKFSFSSPVSTHFKGYSKFLLAAFWWSIRKVSHKGAFCFMGRKLKIVLDKKVGFPLKHFSICRMFLHYYRLGKQRVLGKWPTEVFMWQLLPWFVLLHCMCLRSWHSEFNALLSSMLMAEKLSGCEYVCAFDEYSQRQHLSPCLCRG